MGIKRYNIPHNTTYLTFHRNESLNKKTMPSRRAKLIDEAIFGLIHYPHYHPNNMQVMVHRPICGFNERPTPPPVEDNFVIGERSSIFHHCHCQSLSQSPVGDNFVIGERSSIFHPWQQLSPCRKMSQIIQRSSL